MKEQSHTVDMSAALRGDFQRLRERGVPAALVPQDVEPPEEDDPVEDDPVEDVPSEEPPPRRTWVSRLAGR